MNPGYYLTDPAATVMLPRVPRWSSEDVKTVESSIDLETDLGVQYVYPLTTRRVRSYTFRVPLSELAAFQTLHDAVIGKATPFYYLLDYTDAMDSPSVALLVRKEAHFEPVKIGPATENGVTSAWYDYTLTITTEITAASVLA